MLGNSNYKSSLWWSCFVLANLVSRSGHQPVAIKDLPSVINNINYTINNIYLSISTVRNHIKNVSMQNHQEVAVGKFDWICYSWNVSKFLQILRIETRGCHYFKKKNCSASNCYQAWLSSPVQYSSTPSDRYLFLFLSSWDWSQQFLCLLVRLYLGFKSFKCICFTIRAAEMKKFAWYYG